jgi:hypothetical protein
MQSFYPINKTASVFYLNDEFVNSSLSGQSYFDIEIGGRTTDVNLSVGLWRWAENNYWKQQHSAECYQTMQINHNAIFLSSLWSILIPPGCEDLHQQIWRLKYAPFSHGSDNRQIDPIILYQQNYQATTGSAFSSIYFVSLTLLSNASVAGPFCWLRLWWCCRIAHAEYGQARSSRFTLRRCRRSSSICRICSILPRVARFSLLRLHGSSEKVELGLQ